MPGNRRASPPGLARRGVLGRAVAVGLGAVLPLRLAVAAHLVRAWPAERPVPPLDVVDLAGKPWRLEAHAGRVVVLNFWATWCEPCRLEMPSLDAMAARRRREGVVVAAVNYKEAPEVIRRYLERAGFKAQVLLDSDGDATVNWTPRVFPSTVLIGRNGQPVLVVVGESTGKAPRPRRSSTRSSPRPVAPRAASAREALPGRPSPHRARAPGARR